MLFRGGISISAGIKSKLRAVKLILNQNFGMKRRGKYILAYRLSSFISVAVGFYFWGTEIIWAPFNWNCGRISICIKIVIR